MRVRYSIKQDEPAEREASILQYWKVVELFSPQKIPRVNPNNWNEPVLRATGETPLPWDKSHWFCAPEAGHTWRFTAVSRAKRRLFVIGNRAEWSEYPYFSDASALLAQEEKLRARGVSGSC